MRIQDLGKHLHNQVILPLLAASIAVALIATVVGVYRLDAITRQWMLQGAEQSLRAARSEVEAARSRISADAKLIAESPELISAVGSDRPRRIARAVSRLRESADVDNVVLLGADGRALAAAGALGILPGDSLLTTEQAKYSSLGMRFATLLEAGGIVTLSAIEPKDYDGVRYVVVASILVDREFLKRDFQGLSSAIAFAPAGRAPTTFFVDSERVRADSGSQAVRDLASSLAHPSPEMLAAVASPGSPHAFDSGGLPFTLLSGQALGPAVEGARLGDSGADPTGASANIAVVVSDSVATDTGRTTIVLIAFWSLVAVVVLTGLGAIIARRVSSPLVELSESARRVADGDFSAKVEIGGSNEVADLAHSFNAMTDSLREHTESLTKKVLELATMYEMSRSLGSTLDLDTLLESVLDSAMRIFDVETGYVILRNTERDAMEVRAWRGPTARPDEKAVRSSMSDWVIKQGRPLIFNPSSGGSGEMQVDSVTGAPAALCVPLVSGDGILGAIAVGSRERSYRFTADDVRLLSTIANHVTIAIGNIELFSSLQDAYLATVRSLAAAVDAKDPYTRGHSDNVAEFSRRIGEKLGLSAEQAVALEMAAYLHDIGKIGVRESILLKPGRLSDDEMSQMRHHPLIGASILKPVAFPWPITPVVRHHHEHWDGKGYPAGLQGEEIPLLARILSVADSFEAMTADRPYRRGRNRAEAVEELRRCQSSQFDPRVVDALIDVLDEYEEDDAGREARAAEEVQPEEARAIFVALADGMFGGFRRLGGPRLATNLEHEMNDFFGRQGISLSIDSGHVSAQWPANTPLPSQLDDMRATLAHLSSSMGSATGRTLVDHFHDEALDALSLRMRRLAQDLNLYERE